MSQFQPPFYQFNGHIQTIYPSLFRKVPVPYERERIELPDGDFLDLDWLKTGSKKLVIVTHGLEGDSTRHYVTGLLKLFSEHGFDGLGWNSRSCSGELNRLPRFYHHGDAEDLRYVLEYAIAEGGYEEVFLAGYSMGGSLTLRLLGEFPEKLPKEVSGAMVASVPLDIYSSVLELQKPGKTFYMNRFIKKLAVKIEAKSKLFPDHPHLKFEGYFDRIKNFEDFDGTYTAPLHGYKSAHDFYARASTKPLLKNIRVPVKIVQALNDPFLGQECLALPDDSPLNVELLMPKKGGHVGFMISGEPFSFTEQLALDFALKA
ncbi:YheT family hydrolase [Jiulongibacter sediminis]|uniref:Alpha/beta hydrolase n=1 Tax=Jiulongibacter sediminis TaxID=1605367 RepID=A0A0P7C9Q3_9BACT|nr:alpha/beta fold hydrolase [Jiulongibacter sediminis]KPM49272.1 alpha/beta hydrolase [Jiulongibacter sediminis]TBX26327.1 alpha/beta hydrolase [Jiulongibacter sediminis]